MQCLKNATPCRTAESHGLGATLVFPCWRGSTGEGTAYPSTQHQNGSCGCSGDGGRRPSGRVGLHRTLIGTLGYNTGARAAKYSSPGPGRLPQVVRSWPYSLPSTRPAVGSSLVVLCLDSSDFGVWPTEGPASFLLAARTRPADRVHRYPISSASPHT